MMKAEPKGPIPEIATQSFALYDEGKFIGVVGLQVQGLVGDEYAIWFKPGRDFRPVHLRRMLRTLHGEVGDTRILACVDTDKPKNLRFAEAFGFASIGERGSSTVMELQKWHS